MREFIAIIIVFYLFLLWFAFVVFSIPPILIQKGKIMLVQVEETQYGLRDDMIMTAKEVGILLGLKTNTVCKAIRSGKLKGTRVGQGGYGKKRLYNDETTWSYVVEWRSNMEKVCKPSDIAIIVINKTNIKAA